MAKILVIEDEANVSGFIKKGLQESGHQVDAAFDGAMGLRMACNGEYDLIVLDVVLPQMNGIELCRRFRASNGNSIPVIMLTALGTTEDVVTGLETGADDYVVKPFKFKELLARISVQLKRKGFGYKSKSYEFAGLVLNNETKSVTREGQSITLTSREFKLLELLISNPNRVYSRSDILEYVWDASMDPNTNVVEVYISYLRNKVDTGFGVRLIHTLIGMGYVMREG